MGDKERRKEEQEERWIVRETEDEVRVGQLEITQNEEHGKQ